MKKITIDEQIKLVFEKIREHTNDETAYTWLAGCRFVISAKEYGDTAFHRDSESLHHEYLQEKADAVNWAALYRLAKDREAKQETQ